MTDQSREFSLVIVLDELQGNQDWTSLHQCLLMLLDSPFNHEGHLSVLIRLQSLAKYIRVHREIRIPRTFKRFNQLFCNFLNNPNAMPVVPTKTGHSRLIEEISKSTFNKLVQDEQNCQSYSVANLAPKLRKCNHFAESTCTANKAVIFVLFGPVNLNYLGVGRDTEYQTKTIDYKRPQVYSISRYPISAELICAKLVSSFEYKLGIQ